MLQAANTDLKSYKLNRGTKYLFGINGLNEHVGQQSKV